MAKRILLVEDNRDIRETLEAFLQMKGYTVASAENGARGLDLLRDDQSHESPARVVLLDLMMPDMNGWEFRERQLADPGLAEVPVIVMTGASLSPEERDGLQAIDVMKKPIDLPRLLDYLATLFG